LRQSVAALLSALKPGQVKPSASWLHDLAEHAKPDAERMKTHLAANPKPKNFYGVLGAIRGVLADKPDVYLVNEGATVVLDLPVEKPTTTYITGMLTTFVTHLIQFLHLVEASWEATQ
jgi:hypothetical protein